MKQYLLYLLLISGFLGFSQKFKTDSLLIFYPTHEYKLDSIQTVKIDSFLNIKHLLNIKEVHIDSYTDAVGSNISNDSLSKNRANTITNLVKNLYYYHDYIVNYHGEHPSSNPKIPEQKNHRVSIIKRTYQVYPNDSINCYLDNLLLKKPKETIVLKDIHFEWGRYRLTRDSFEQVQNLYYFLEKNPTLVIEIQGHVCCGNPKEARGEMESAHNLKLSTNRAKEVKKVLVMLGINEERIKTIGYGFTRPRFFPQKTKEEAYQNRRIEIAYLKK